MEVSALGRAVDHARLAIENSPLFFLLDPSVPVELGRELDFDLDLFLLIYEGFFGHLNAELVLASILSLVLILHIGVHISIEKLSARGIGEHQPDALIRGASPLYQLIVRLN